MNHFLRTGEQQIWRYIYTLRGLWVQCAALNRKAFSVNIYEPSKPSALLKPTRKYQKLQFLEWTVEAGSKTMSIPIRAHLKMHSFATRDKEKPNIFVSKANFSAHKNLTGVNFYATHSFKTDLDLKLCMIRGAASFRVCLASPQYFQSPIFSPQLCLWCRCFTDYFLKSTVMFCNSLILQLNGREMFF